MPNDDHVAMLGCGAAVWNEWRAKHDGAPDLSGAGLRGLDLSGFDLSRVDLRSADLRGNEILRRGSVRRPSRRCELLQSCT